MPKPLLFALIALVCWLTALASFIAYRNTGLSWDFWWCQLGGAFGFVGVFVLDAAVKKTA